MTYALIYKPQIDTSLIDMFQQEYDPYYHLAGAHFTLIFPTPEMIGEDQLIQHIKNTLDRWKPFKIHIQGLEKSWDNWLYLLVQEGNSELTKLHDELYAGIMSPFLRKDLPYIPHIGLGLFIKRKRDYKVTNPRRLSFNQSEFERVYKKAKSLNLNYETMVEKLELVKLDNELKKIVWVKKFILK
ncbi:2'-5' RNA ligase family protein [Candidatus Daviesbacteria bacterium]|nr:2'-5' RNA ligase family protein [Candidatus Daviesbacteria bacterium]